MADTVVCPYYMADTRVCPYHSPLTTRYSLPFSPVANHQSPFTAVLTSRQSLITSRCRPRQSLIASRCLSRYSPLTTPAISSPLSGCNQFQDTTKPATHRRNRLTPMTNRTREATLGNLPCSFRLLFLLVLPTPEGRTATFPFAFPSLAPQCQPHPPIPLAESSRYPLFYFGSRNTLS